MKTILLESYKGYEKKHNRNPLKNTRQMMADKVLFESYIDHLSEGIQPKDVGSFRQVCQNIRKLVIEQASYGVNPYESLLLPVFRTMWPRTIAKDLVTTIAMNKPDMFKPFIRSKFAKANSNSWLTAPVMSDVSSGPQMSFPVSSLSFAVPSASANIIERAGLTVGSTHVERTMHIVGVNDGGTDSTSAVTLHIIPDVNGRFSSGVTFSDGRVDKIAGIVDFNTGDFTVACTNGVVKNILVSGTLSLEENTINPKVELYLENLRLVATDRQVSGSWTIQMEQDIKALYDLDAQAEMASTIGKQITNDLDSETINNLIAAAELETGHQDTFSCIAPETFTWGPKAWHENILVKLNALSAKIYDDTKIQSGNVIAANPMDAAILESLNSFIYKGDGADGGDVGTTVASLASNKWKVLVSSIVPKGKMVVTYKPTEETNAVYLFAVYQPLVLSPYLMGRTPNMTFISRNANTLVRSAGVAVLNLTGN